MPGDGFFVTGTDTGVGKTLVSCCLVSALLERGLDVGVMKPIETGVEKGRALDALALRDAAKSRDPIEEICPIRFELPAAPSVAAEAARVAIDINVVLDAYSRLSERHEVMVVEGAGGLMVPILPGLDMGHLASELGLPLIVVARTALGTINHTLLTLREIEARGLALAGVVLSHATGPISQPERANLEHLRRELGARLVGELEALAPGESPPIDGIDLDQLLA